MSKHTPDVAQRILELQPNLRLSVHQNDYDHGYSQGLADATGIVREDRLIAAAPELLEVLRLMVEAIHNPDKMSGVLLGIAESVIAKAEGK